MANEITSSISPPNVQQPYLDLTIGGVSAGRLVVNLWTTDAPETCAIFTKLCTGERGVGYKGATFLTDGAKCFVVASELTQSSNTPFPPDLMTTPDFATQENRWGKHNERGLVTMNIRTNGTFAVMFQAYSAWDGQSVIIGELTEESLSVLEKVEEVPREVVNNVWYQPTKEIKITSCGVLGL